MSLGVSQQRAYKLILVEYPYCMACGRDATERPAKWGAPWRLERAHLAAGRSKMCRHEDRRAVVSLCGRCHLLHSTHGRGVARINGLELPRLSNAHVLWIKRERDPEWWDLAWIQERWLDVVPDPESPPEWFLAEFESRGRI